MITIHQTFQLSKSYSNVQIRTMTVYLCYTSQEKFIFPLIPFILLKTFEIIYLIINDFFFPSFTFNGFKDAINLRNGGLKWNMLHHVFERDAQLDDNLKKAAKLTLKVLHPCSNKQSVPLAIAIFDETTSAAIQSYFPQHSSALEFWQLFEKWWIISNSKS